MTKSYFKMVPTTCQPAECEGAIPWRNQYDEVTHGKNVYCHCYGFMLRLRKRGKIDSDDLPMSVGEGRYQLC